MAGERLPQDFRDFERVVQDAYMARNAYVSEALAEGSAALSRAIVRVAGNVQRSFVGWPERASVKRAASSR